MYITKNINSLMLELYIMFNSVGFKVSNWQNNWGDDYNENHDDDLPVS